MKPIFLGSWVFMLVLTPLLLQTNAYPKLVPSLCLFYGINCQSGDNGNSKVLGKTGLTQQSDEREFSFADPVNWTPAFYPQGTSGPVLDILVEGDSVYASGEAGRADSIKTWGLSLWNGRGWISPVKKTPFELGWFSQIFKFKGKTYFGGDYSNDIPGSRFLPSWNGQDWETKPLPYNDITLSMAAWEGKLILASFMEGLWQFEDSLVAPFHPQLEGVILDVTVQAGRLWVRGGELKVPGDTSRHGIAYLENGAWKFPSPVQSRSGVDWAWLGQEAFMISGKAIFYPMIDPTLVSRWNGAEWSQLVLEPSAGLPRVLASDGKNVYLVGTDRVVRTGSALGDEGLRISKWDGQKFNLVDRQAFFGSVSQAKVINGGLILAGSFQKIGDVRADNLARWDGDAWTPYSLQLRPGLAVPASATLSWGDKLIFGGDGISMAGKIPVTNIAAWSDAGWSALGGGIRAQETVSSGDRIPYLGVKVAALAANAGRLYAGGRFDSAGNRSARNIAQWDGQSWTSMGEGLPFEVAGLLANGPDLYAVGAVRTTLQGGLQVSLRDAAHWNGAVWNPLESLHNPAYAIHLAYFNGALWTSSGGSLSKWNGTGWESLNIGMEEITSLITHKNALYITEMGRRLIKYEGGVLDTLPNFVSAYQFASDGENLFVSGEFDLPGFPNTTLARWDGKSWTPMANLFSNLDHMVVHGDHLYISLGHSGLPTPIFEFYLRWNRKTGTWNKVDTKASAPEKAKWKTLPCVHDCFLSEREVMHGVFDVQGRNTRAGSKGRGGPPESKS